MVRHIKNFMIVVSFNCGALILASESPTRPPVPDLNKPFVDTPIKVATQKALQGDSDLERFFTDEFAKSKGFESRRDYIRDLMNTYLVTLYKGTTLGELYEEQNAVTDKLKADFKGFDESAINALRHWAQQYKLKKMQEADKERKQERRASGKSSDSDGSGSDKEKAASSTTKDVVPPAVPPRKDDKPLKGFNMLLEDLAAAPNKESAAPQPPKRHDAPNSPQLVFRNERNLDSVAPNTGAPELATVQGSAQFEPQGPAVVEFRAQPANFTAGPQDQAPAPDQVLQATGDVVPPLVPALPVPDVNTAGQTQAPAQPANTTQAPVQTPRKPGKGIFSKKVLIPTGLLALAGVYFIYKHNQQNKAARAA